ncbi:MAG: MBL fold metallo-hydrolase, partial [Bacteroidetes bacterium]|nr:MBL fold metallo-hydrolase [Bacteroidota bacterium]
MRITVLVCDDQMSAIFLEDSHQDILGKAMRGLGIGKNDMARRLGVEKSEIEAILNGEVNEKLINAMAGELQLDDKKLLGLAKNEWCPEPLEIVGLKQISSTYGDMMVNAYVVWDEESKNAWIFDTGTEALPIFAFIEKQKLKVDAIFLTHTHRDHIACLDDLRKGAGNPSVYVHELEALDGCESITEGFSFRCASLSINALHTHGHALGGMTYVIVGLERPIAIVGDAIFAGSMGGG